MGLNIGVRVKKQDDGPMSLGHNPTTNRTLDEAEQVFKAFLDGEFPQGGFVAELSFCEVKQSFDFDVYFSRRGADFGTDRIDDMFLAITRFVYENFSVDEGIDMHVWQSV